MTGKASRREFQPIFWPGRYQTDEMLVEFAHLGEERARGKWSLPTLNKINDMIDDHGLEKAEAKRSISRRRAGSSEALEEHKSR